MELRRVRSLRIKKLSHYMPWRLLGDGRYTSYSFTLALEWGEWSVSLPCHALPQGKGPAVPNGQEAAWASRVGLNIEAREKSTVSAGDRTLRITFTKLFNSSSACLQSGW